MNRTAPLVLLLLSTTAGCGDYTLTATFVDDVGDTGIGADGVPASGTGDATEEEDPCGSTTAFDIEEVSTLQDAFGLPSVRDGLSLSVPEQASARGWRPTEVEVLVSYPVWYFEYMDDSNVLTATIYPSDRPQGEAWSVRTPVRRADLDWQPLTLPPDADWSGDDREQMAAWLTFDFSSQVSLAALHSTDYFVAISWDTWGFPNVGYSNFELDCAANWSDYGDGRWVQNSGVDCSWPMLRITTEVGDPEDC